MMRKRNKLLSLILAAAMTVTGLPVTPTVWAGDSGEPAVLNQTAKVRFIQKVPHRSDGTVTDETAGFENGILTMSLQIKPETYVEDGETKYYSVKDGMFVFQVDSSSIIPITAPATDGSYDLIRTGIGTTVVASTPEEGTAMYNYLENNRDNANNMVRRLGRIDATSNIRVDDKYKFFNDVMGTTNLSVGQTAYLVSNARASQTGKLDCYVQYRFENMSDTLDKMDEDGYVTVMDLYFLCRSGYDENGQPKAAEDTGVLFAGSVTVPQDQTGVDEILRQFSYYYNNRLSATTAATQLNQLNTNGGTYGPAAYTAGTAAEALQVWNNNAHTQVSYEAQSEAEIQQVLDGQGTASPVGNKAIQLSYVVPVSQADATDKAAALRTQYPGVTITVGTQSTPQRALSVSMASGGAGFVMHKMELDTYTLPNGRTVTRNVAKEKTATYYYDTPVITSWKREADPQTQWTTAEAVQVTGRPYVWYVNQDVRYLVTGFDTIFANTFTDQELKQESVGKAANELTLADYEENANPDFDQPKDDLGYVTLGEHYARYMIPTATEAAAKTTLEDWAPRRWSADAARRNTVMPLKYHVRSEVTEGALSRPELDAANNEGKYESYTGNGGLAAFAQELTWKFCTEDGQPLDEYVAALRAAGYTISPTENKDTFQVLTADNKYYTVTELIVKSKPENGNSNLVGTKFWQVELDGKTDITPVGVTMDMVTTKLYYTDDLSVADGEDPIEGSGDVIAPQLHISNLAADPQSYLWMSTSGATCPVYFRTTYEYGGVEYASQPMTAILYGSTRQPDHIGLVAGDIPHTGPGSDEGLEMWVGKPGLTEDGADTMADRVSQGVVFYALIYDQYGVAYTDRFATISISKTGMAEEDIPFTVTYTNKASAQIEGEKPDSKYAYTIKYGLKTVNGRSVDMNANDVVPGTYTINMSYNLGVGKGTISDTVDMEVKRTENYLAYLGTRLIRTSTVESIEEETDALGNVVGTTTTLTYDVPTLENCNQSGPSIETVIVDELANQWRQENGTKSDYDVVPGMRNARGQLDLDLVNAASSPVHVSFEASYYRSWMDEKGVWRFSDEPENGAPVPEGVDVSSLLTRGSFTYNNNVKNGAKFDLRVTATYINPASSAVSTVYREYHFRFQRQTRVVTRVEIDNLTDIKPNGSTGGAKTLTLATTPYDQYDTEWNWTGGDPAENPSVATVYDYRIPGSMNPTSSPFTWKIVLASPASALEYNGTTEVTLGSDRYDTDQKNNVITVAQGAHNHQFQIYVTYGNEDWTAYDGNVVNDLYTVNVRRDPSTPDRNNSSLRYYTYNSRGALTETLGGTESSPVLAPGKNRADARLGPKLAVRDQYNELIPEGEYTVRYTVESVKNASGATVSDEEKSKVEVDPDTGVLSVHALAVNCVVTIRADMKTPSGSGSVRATVYVKRDTPITQQITLIEQAESQLPQGIEFPSNKGTGSNQTQLTARGETQYGAGQTYTPNQLTWQLDKVVLRDGTELVWVAPSEQATTTIPEERWIRAQGSGYEGGVIRLTNRGMLTFGNTTDVNQLPQSITVTAIPDDNNTDTAARKQDTIKINVPTPEPYELIMSVDDQINVDRPVSGGADKVVTLNARIRDQYGCIHGESGWEVTWTPVQDPLPSGMSFSGNTVTITQDTDWDEEIQVVASHTGLEESKYRTVTVHVKAENEDNYRVTKVNILRVTDPVDKSSQEFSTGAVSLVLPSDEETTKDYTLVHEIIHNYSNGVWKNRVVSWSIQSVADQNGVVPKDGDGNEITGFVEISDYYRQRIERQLVLHYNKKAAEFLNDGNKIYVTVKADSVDPGVDGNPVPETAVIEIKLNTYREPAYAVPKVLNGALTNPLENGKPIVPGYGDPDTEILWGATVYDQYGLVLQTVDTPKMDAVFVLENLNQEYVSFDASRNKTYSNGDGENSAIMVVQSPQRDLVLQVTAYPAAIPVSERNAKTGRTVEQGLDQGPIGPARLALYSLNEDSFQIPTLDLSQAAREGYVLPDDNESETFQLRAEVLSQYNGWLESSARDAGIRPVWKLAGTYVGVALADPMNTAVRERGAETPVTMTSPDNGEIATEVVTVKMTNKAVAKDETQTRVSFDLRTQGLTGDNFVTSTTVTLYKDPANPSAPSFLMFTGSDSTGRLDTEVLRPPLNADGTQGKTEYTVRPVIYDQYGYAKDEIQLGTRAGQDITVDLDVDAIERQIDGDGLVEPLYPGGLTEEELDLEDGEALPEPIGYRIYHATYELPEPEEDPDPDDPLPDPVLTDRKLMAEFDRATGKLTVYTDCDILKEVTIKATYDSPVLNGYGRKDLVIPIDQEPAHPAAISLPSNQVVFTIEEDNEDVMMENIQPVVLDQYGQIYTGRPIYNWGLYMAERDDSGNLVPYYDIGELITTDVEGNEVVQEYPITDLDQCLLNYVRSTTSATITVTPTRFKDTTKAIFSCEMIDPSDRNNRMYQYVEVTVQKKVAPAGGPIVAGSVTLTFDAGEYGKLVGPAVIEVDMGALITGAPGVKTVTGYGFIGWTTDGETLVDVSQLEATGSMTFYAVYRDVSVGEFLEGYSDGTVRPTAAVTRGEFTTMLVRAMGGYDPDVDYGVFFSDVPAGKWYSNYIAFSKVQGVAAGYPDGTFKPEQPITRAEAARLLAVTAGLLVEGDDNFKDVPDGKWYTDSVSALKEAGVASGYPDGTYRPNQDITRAEAVKLIVSLTNNALDDVQRDNIRECAYCPFSDIDKGYWAYAYILRAAGIA